MNTIFPTLYGFTTEQIRDLIEHYWANTDTSQQALIEENLKLRGKVSFYETHIAVMNEVKEKK